MQNLPLVIFTTILIEKSPQSLPLGAACVASSVKNNPLTKSICKTVLIDFCAEDAKFIQNNTSLESITDYIVESLLVNNPSIICFSIYVWNRIILDNVCKKLKQKNIICIAGGPEVTANPRSFDFYDYAVTGEGESKVSELIYKIFTKNALPSSYDKNFYSNIENFTSPYLDNTIDLTKYDGALWELARGCPFKCSYCYESKGEKKVRLFPLERIQKELQLFKEKNISQVFVLDPTYNANKDRALKLINLIKKYTPNTFYYFEARAEFIDRELAKAFTQIPCALQIGLQSADENILRLVDRPFNKKVFVKNINILNEYGVVFGLDLIYGLPKDTLQNFYNSVNFAFSLYPNNLEIFCLSVLPGTALYDKATELNLTFQTTPPYNVIKTDFFSIEDLQKASNIAKATSYFYNAGRAVPWLNIICNTLKINCVKFLNEFFDFAKQNKIDLKISNSLNCNHNLIEENQIKFVVDLLKKKNLNKLILLVTDIIKLNGAFSRKTDTGKSEKVSLNYPVDYLMSEYVFDLFYFEKNVKMKKNVFVT